MSVWWVAIPLSLHCVVKAVEYRSAVFDTSVSLPLDDITCYDVTNDGGRSTTRCAIECQHLFCYAMRWEDGVCIICMLPGATPPTGTSINPPPTDLMYKQGEIYQHV